MEYQPVPLEEQLKKAAGRMVVFPEYPACAVRAWAKTPITAYLGGDSEKGKERRQKLRSLLGISLPEEEGLYYRDVAERVFYKMLAGEQKAEKALLILAEPLAEAYKRWKEEQREKNAKNTT